MVLDKLMALVLVAVTTTAAARPPGQLLDPRLPEYQRTAGIAGNLSSTGSDTLANLMTLWAERFQDYYPQVPIQVQAAGSSTATPALVQSTANLGPMSRLMKAQEVAAFKARFGYAPTPVPVAVDALAVFVHRDNPLEGLTLAQLDAIFSRTRRCGHPLDIERWSQLGLKDALGQREIQLFGRNSVSGTYGYFKEHALCQGDFKDSVSEQPGSASVVQSVGTTPQGIGYSGIGYRTASVRALPLAFGDGPLVAATAENAIAGQYPLARLLYIYVNKPPDQPLAPLEREFLRLVLSREGQGIILKDGYVPLPLSRVRDSLKLLELK